MDSACGGMRADGSSRGFSRGCNPMERIIREIRRRTREVGAFPDGSSALMLVARLRHIAVPAASWTKNGDGK